MVSKLLLDRITEYINKYYEPEPATASDSISFFVPITEADLIETAGTMDMVVPAICSEPKLQSAKKSKHAKADTLCEPFDSAFGAGLPAALTVNTAKEFEPQDESFAEMLLRLIDERGWKDSYCYKKANLTRAHFSRIKNEKDYRIGKNSACALALALELSPEEAEDFLKKAGFFLSNSMKNDIIVRYCIENQIYNVNKVNEILFEYDQALLGAR